MGLPIISAERRYSSGFGATDGQSGLFEREINGLVSYFRPRRRDFGNRKSAIMKTEDSHIEKHQEIIAPI